MVQRNIRILIVDDSEEVRDDLSTVLGMLDGIEVAGVAANGREAVEQAGKLHPDVVLMDIEMPVLDGFEATRRIKSLGLGACVLILSVYNSNSTRLKAELAGADGFIEKGTPVKKVGEIIRKCLK